MTRRESSSLRVLGLAVLLAAPVATGFAQTEGDNQSVGQVVRDFAWPQDTATGERKAVLHGHEAKVVTAQRTEIIDMKIELYENGQPTTIITSPFCNFWRVENKLSTDKTVFIHKPNMDITAQTLQWDYVNSRGVLRDHVKVVLRNFSLADPVQPGGGQPVTNQPSTPMAPPSHPSPNP